MPISIKIIPPAISALLPNLVSNFLPINTATKEIIKVTAAIIKAEIMAKKHYNQQMLNQLIKHQWM